MKARFAALFTASLCAANLAMAAPVTWTLDQVFTEAGFAVTGAFTYDRSSDIYSSVSIFSEDTGITRACADQGFSSAAALYATDCLGGTYVGLRFAETLSDLGGSVDLLTGVGGSYDVIFTPDLEPAWFREGRVVARSAVPEPATLVLLGLALAGLAVHQRRALPQR